ncbi:Ctr copper transporter [Lophiotrema nucula]|uniref:Copper transport protein n=1 Tax=Lophiotrema nucula TaxID=690887 RepID=A0A6A5YM34_9PLEO|nr:Ctr copper transporter [Lophiotrema nucula]
MSSMASTFSVNTRVTLFFTEWTTTTPGTYTLTVIFLFSLGIFNRFLGAMKTQLERRWKEEGQQQPKEYDVAATTSPSRSTLPLLRRHVRRWSEALRPTPSKAMHDEEEFEPLSLMPVVNDASLEKQGSHLHQRKGRFWVAFSRWNFKRDGIRSLLEFIRALIGYILMLAVMTYNVGFLFAITGSVLLGE